MMMSHDPACGLRMADTEGHDNCDDGDATCDPPCGFRTANTKGNGDDEGADDDATGYL